jgi:hypothetical protein
MYNQKIKWVSNGTNTVAATQIGIKIKGDGSSEGSLNFVY